MRGPKKAKPFDFQPTISDVNFSRSTWGLSKLTQAWV
jgi:hypothetical protein